MSGRIAWQSWVLIILTGSQFAISQVQGNSEKFPMPDWIALVLLPTMAVLITLAANQLKAIGGPPPNVPVTPETIKPNQPEG